MKIERETIYKLELTQHEYEALFGCVRAALGTEAIASDSPYGKTGDLLLAESGR